MEGNGNAIIKVITVVVITDLVVRVVDVHSIVGRSIDVPNTVFVVMRPFFLATYLFNNLSVY